MRPGKPVHISQVLGVAADPNTIDAGEVDTGAPAPAAPVPVQFRINIPRRRSVVDTVAQDLAGPNWNGGPILSGRRQASRTRGGNTSRLSIRNTSAAGGESMQVSFDNGINFFTLGPEEAFSWEINVNYFVVRPVNLVLARATDITFEAIAVVH